MRKDSLIPEPAGIPPIQISRELLCSPECGGAGFVAGIEQPSRWAAWCGCIAGAGGGLQPGAGALENGGTRGSL